MLYISTGGFRNITAYDACIQLNKNGINTFELSGGKYDPNFAKNIKNLAEKFDIKIHNYFPPPKHPFVINLASNNQEIAKLSINHIKSSIKLASEVNSKYYSFHAGFLIDPKVKELGKTISKSFILERSAAMDIFLKRVHKLADFARNHGVELLVENNVISKKNYQEFGQDVLLMTNASECEYFFNNAPSDVGMLLDFAHLKVSSKTLNFSALKFIETCNKFIKGYHFSDNDGSSDSNHPIHYNSWFWKYINRNLDYYTLEVYNLPFDRYLSQYNLLNQFLKK